MDGQLLDAVKSFYDRFRVGDLDAAIELFDPEIRSTNPGGTIDGRAAFRGYAQVFKAAFPDSGMTILTAIESGDTVVIEGVYSGTHTGTLATPTGDVPPTGRPIELPYCELFGFADGRIATQHVYYDQVAFMTQLGLMPEPSQAGP